MKNLEEYAEEIYKCTKCGLCQSVCPLYELTGKETAVSRGKFALLNAILQNKMKITPKIREAMDLCISCKACDDFCPSGISAEKIITAARAKCTETMGLPFTKKIINKVLASNLLLFLISILFKLYNFLKISWISSKLFLPKKIIIFFATLDAFLKVEIKYENKDTKLDKKNTKIMYFPGCVNKYFNKSTYNALKMVLEVNGYELLETPNFSCCGMTAKNIGDIKTYKKLAKMNLNKIPNDIDFLVVDCASCYSTLVDYSDLTDIELKPKISNLQDKIIHINQLLLKLDIKFDTEKSQNLLPITYHVPCHLKRYKGLTEYSKALINKIVNIEFNEMKEEDKCCGMSGTFMVCNSSLSKKITLNKITNITDTKSKLVVTDCSGCKIGLIKGIVENQLDFPVLQPVELLAKLYLVTK